MDIATIGIMVFQALTKVLLTHKTLLAQSRSSGSNDITDEQKNAIFDRMTAKEIEAFGHSLSAESTRRILDFTVGVMREELEATRAAAEADSLGDDPDGQPDSDVLEPEDG